MFELSCCTATQVFLDTLFLDFSKGDSCYLSSIVKTHHHVESPCGANSWVTSSKHLHQIQVLNIFNAFILGERITIIYLRRDLYFPPLFIWQRSPPRMCFLEIQSCKQCGNATIEPSVGRKNSLDGFLSSTHMMTFTPVRNMSGTRLTTGWTPTSYK